MVLLDLLHVQRAGFFKFLKLGINKELSQLNINLENTRLQVVPFANISSPLVSPEITNQDSLNKCLVVNKSLAETMIHAPFPRMSLSAIRPDKKRHANIHAFNKNVRTSNKIHMLLHKENMCTPSYLDVQDKVTKGKYAYPLGVNVLTPKGYIQISTFLNIHTLTPKSSFVNSYFAPSIKDLPTPEVTPLVRGVLTSSMYPGNRWAGNGKGSYITRSIEVDTNKCISKKRPKVLDTKNWRLLSSTISLKTLFSKQKEIQKLTNSQEQSIKHFHPKGHEYVTKEPSVTINVKKKTESKAVLLKSKVLPPSEGVGRPHVDDVSKIQSCDNNQNFSKTALSLAVNCCFRLVAPKYTPREAILYQKSWNCKLVIKVLLTMHEKKTKSRLVITKGETQDTINQKFRSLKYFYPNKVKLAQFTVSLAHQNKFKQFQSINRDNSHSNALPENEDTKHLIEDLPSPLVLDRPTLKGCSTAALGPSRPGYSSNSETYDNTCSLRASPKSPKGMGSLTKYKHNQALVNNTNTSNVRSHELFLVLGELPLMTRRGHFIINGSPRVILSQLIRTPGIYFTHKNNELQADCIPEQGPWLCIYKNLNDGSYYCYTKQFSSMPFSLIFSTFRIFELHSQFTDQTLLLIKLKTLEKLRKLKQVITTLLTFTWKKRIRKRLQKLYTKKCFVSTQQFEKTKILFRLKKKLVLGTLSRKSFNEKLGISSCINTGITQNVFSSDSFMPNPFGVDKGVTSSMLGLAYKKPYVEIENGGDKNIGISNWLNSTNLLSQDLALIVGYLNGYKIFPLDDIDDLNNQQVRTSSDQIQQQVRIGIFRLKKMFLKLVSSGPYGAPMGSTSQTITDFLNGTLREFFGGNPLSQFLDQTNPLAEITHKRRISKLGVGGIQRESATLKVRTIHSTYFGRICPIETPEGLNAGLVNSLTCLSRVDEKGQLVTPLSFLIKGQKQEQFFYYSNKENNALSTTDTPLLKFQRLPNQFINTKNKSQFQQLQAARIKLRVTSDLQTISLATALIPFLAYDDANRALMGSNMQRQAVPLILPERPMIRTGMESLVINESGHSFQSSSGGFISYISAQHVVIICAILNKRLLIK